MTFSDNRTQPLGKNRHDENFPVGSWLIAPPLRRHIHVYYRFARAADDIADAPDLAPAEKRRRLDRIAAILDGAPGDEAPFAADMRASLHETGLDPVHCHDLLDAFRMDAAGTRYADWDSLMGYCRLSAVPVGRYLLDLHGESRSLWPMADALCAILQIINHLQDCAADYRLLGRVYIPESWLAAEGASPADLTAASCSPELRRTLRRVTAALDPLFVQARNLPHQIRSSRLRLETRAIIALAAKIARRLNKEDVLARPIRLGKIDAAVAVIEGLIGIGA